MVAFHKTHEKWYLCNVSLPHQYKGVIKKSIPNYQEISPDPRDFPREISKVKGNLKCGGDGFPNNSLVLVEHGFNLDMKIFKA